jgi:molecular chaperone HtpG
MTIELSTAAEATAQKAEILTAFGGLNLLHIKRQVAALLGLIGRERIFDEYTKHDISHIEQMLETLDWIIPELTKPAMSTADWLMIVLAIYFHDLGMLVTRDEFEVREQSGFPSYRDNVLFAGPSGADYKAKVDTLEAAERERFLYQEFVRHKHAERIRTWILGQAKESLGIAEAAANEVSKLLEPLGMQFRRDLGFVCESHHLNDLGDTKKYKLAQPYGNSEAETVNLQYCAVLLRTADLLHITSDRTPAIEFRTINPGDPLSQQEWAKQMAVKRVRPKWGVNEEGVLDEKAPRDTIEVHAYFTKEDGFFGLTSYLSYAVDQLKKSNEWITATARLRLAKHEFPWRKIDDANIETEGFIRDAFEFTIDQAKILDLLTGHTLYNDTKVVLRELVQNAIDAIRIKHYPEPPHDKGLVTIQWDSASRFLSVQDNGSGMTQQIINNFLLKVGSSRYQDPEFKKTYPGFSSISRFGIGVLSTFMIADSVEIVTCHPEEEHARHLTLRSVHGKYLIRLLDKNSEHVRELTPYGTIFRLRVRPSVNMPDVVTTAKQWVVMPNCRVLVIKDREEPVSIGFGSAGGALRDFLASQNLDFSEEPEEQPRSGRRLLRIVEKKRNDVELAYALVWNNYFNEWSFLTLASFSLYSRYYLLQRDVVHDALQRPQLGTCIEGIRVVADTPGYEGYPVVAIANVRGPHAPKTNVARSGLEATTERDDMLKEIYTMYAEHIASEISDLSSKRSFSPTWATSESAFLMQPLLRDDDREFQPISSQLLMEALQLIPCVMVEKSGERQARSPSHLGKEKEFWTIESGLLASAELLIREVPSATSLSKIVTALNVGNFPFPDAPVVCGADRRNQVVRAIFEHREVDKIVVNVNLRRVDLRWAEKNNPPRWLELPRETQRLANNVMQERRTFRRDSLLEIPGDGISLEVPSEDIAVRGLGSLYLLPGTEIAAFLRRQVETLYSGQNMERHMSIVAMLGVISDYLIRESNPKDVESVIANLRSYERHAPHLLNIRIEDTFDVGQFASLVVKTNWKLFDTAAWERGVEEY